MIIYVTNRKLCKDDFLQRINQLAAGKPDGIILREKDLKPREYEALALKVKKICENHQVPLVINQNIKTAAKLNIQSVQLSIEHLKKHQNELRRFSNIGASIHSVEEAVEAEQLRATYLIAGHIFSTDCKKGMPPRGLSFLQEIYRSVTLPVFAIGGITTENANEVLMAGAKGVCLMSEAMTTPNPTERTKQLLSYIRSS